MPIDTARCVCCGNIFGHAGGVHRGDHGKVCYCCVIRFPGRWPEHEAAARERMEVVLQDCVDKGWPDVLVDLLRRSGMEPRPTWYVDAKVRARELRGVTAEGQVERVEGLVWGGELEQHLANNAIAALRGPHSKEIVELFDMLSDVQLVLLLTLFGGPYDERDVAGDSHPDEGLSQ